MMMKAGREGPPFFNPAVTRNPAAGDGPNGVRPHVAAVRVSGQHRVSSQR